jgi:hypothetical protein
VTAADGAAEDLISRPLGELFPENGFFGKGCGGARDGALQSVVDPIDGAANYARGANWFFVSTCPDFFGPTVETDPLPSSRTSGRRSATSVG